VNVTFELGVGLRKARLDVANGKVTRVVMDHQKPLFGTSANALQVAQLAHALGVPIEAITDTGWPVMWVSTGIRQLFAPIRSLRDIQSIDSSKVNAELLGGICEQLDPVEQAGYEVMVFTTETVHQTSTVHSRMFAPGIGLPEDPATGSASGGLGAYLIENRVIPATTPTTTIVSEQGLEMGRPSFITIEVDGAPGAVEMVRVGGEVVPLIEGTLSW
jgi:trans-2,3-dihydro-3-hydroxyanthranilate isomerase